VVEGIAEALAGRPSPNGDWRYLDEPSVASAAPQPQ
jgi:hypothetical protein